MRLFKRLFKRLLLSLLSLTFVLILASFLLPKEQHVERSTEIAATTMSVYEYINNPQSFHQWFPWTKLGPEMTVQFTGPESGEGSGMRWQSNQSNVGNGSWVITRAENNRLITMALDFGDRGKASSYFRLQPRGDITHITWGFDTDAGMSPMMRWSGLLMNKMAGKKYVKGLATQDTEGLFCS